MFPIKTIHFIVILLTSWCLIRPPIEGTLIPLIIVYILGFMVACFYAIGRCNAAIEALYKTLSARPWGSSFSPDEFNNRVGATYIILAITLVSFLAALTVPGQILRILTFGFAVTSAIFCLNMFVMSYQYVIDAMET